MTQEVTRKLLEELGGEATTSEIAAHAREVYPDRTLNTYVGQLLNQLENKGFVSRNADLWVLTEQGRTTPIEDVPIEDIDVTVTESDLHDSSLEVVNIVSTLRIGHELNLNALAIDLHKAEYHPETSPFMVYRPSEASSVTLLVPTNGTISIVGGKSKEEVIAGTEQFFTALSDLGIKIGRAAESASVQNTVIKGNLNIELELSTVAVSLGFEQSEYEPKQFPGVIYRMENGSTVLIFRTGKFLVNGSKSYAQALDSANKLRERLEDIGVEFR